MTPLIGFLRQFKKEIDARALKYASDETAESDATSAAITEIGEAIEAAMKRTLLA